MRLMIDSLVPYVNDLNAVAAILRDRLEPRWRSRGLEFEWRLAEIRPLEYANPESLLHIMRIIQEAITNIVRHAKVSFVSVTAEQMDSNAGLPGVRICIGITAAVSPRIRFKAGLQNMKYRAQELGGPGHPAGRRRHWIQRRTLGSHGSLVRHIQNHISTIHEERLLSCSRRTLRHWFRGIRIFSTWNAA